MDLATRDTVKLFLKTAVLTITVGIVFFVSTLFVLTNVLHYRFYTVSGESMYPTFSNGETIVLKDSYNNGGKNSGVLVDDDIVVFKKPLSWFNDHVSSGEVASSDRLIIKRVVASDGDLLEFKNGVFSVNGETVYDTVANNYECSYTGDYSRVLNGDEFFVLGDNANVSLDSRRFFCDNNIDESFVSTDNVVSSGQVVYHYGG